MARRAPAALLSRFELDVSTAPPVEPAMSNGLHVSEEGGSFVLRFGGRWLADFETAGAAAAGLEVELRRRTRWFAYVPEEGHWPIAYQGDVAADARAAYLRWAGLKRLPAGVRIERLG